MTYRDGRPLRQPVDADPTCAPEHGAAPSEAEREIRNRGHEINPVGAKRAAPAVSETFLTVHFRHADLESLKSALMNFGVDAWVAVASSEGPKLVPLSGFSSDGRTP